MPLKATEETRRIVRKPLGSLFRNEDELFKLLRNFRGVIISVGDVVSRKLLEKGLPPSVCVVDGKTLRELVQDVEFFQRERKVLKLRNIPGTISEDSWRVFREALEHLPSTILVEGEEDLLTLVAVETAPEGSLVIYGQPGEGVVTVSVDKCSKKLVSRILGTMEASSNV